MKIVDGALACALASAAALRCSGDGAPALADADGFVDTGDMIEVRGDRCFFIGRRGGVINVGGAKVHPEEVEAVLNSLDSVRAARVFAKASPITGALVAAEIVLVDPSSQGREVGARHHRRGAREAAARTWRRRASASSPICR